LFFFLNLLIPKMFCGCAFCFFKGRPWVWGGGGGGGTFKITFRSGRLSPEVQILTI